MTPLDNVRILEFPGVCQPTRGTLTVLENIHYDRILPTGETVADTFHINRVFYIYDVPEEASRGGHAHQTNTQLLICLAGSLDITLTDGHTVRDFHLDNPAQGLLIPPQVWNSMRNYAPGTVLLVLCSELYNQQGYFNDFAYYKSYIDSTYFS